MVAVYNNWVAAAVVVIFVIGFAGVANAGNVTYDGRSLIIDSQRKILFSGSIHYPRSTPQMWKDIISKAKEGGVDVIQTYVFWNLHEPIPGQYDFSGRYDIVKFIKEVEAQGLYVCLRIGPFIESEWTYGGLPFWLHDVPGIVYRTDNGPFKNFTRKIIDLMKSESLYASQGGPIILTQIENEYGNVEASFGEKGKSYVKWSAKMGLDLQTGVPWIMCKQPDAPDPVINTCNGMRCGETFGGPNSPTKPSLWTENWTSFYQVYGGETYIRSAQDIAYHVALFIAKINGSFINYYMYHGGTNFGRTAAAYVITGYYDQAPIDEYGMLREPKWGHLKELHSAIKSCSTTLLEGMQSNISLGLHQVAYVFELKLESESESESESQSSCAAFLVNTDNSTKTTIVEFKNKTYELLPHSISILPDCQNIIFNTAKVNVKPNRRITKSTLKLQMWEKYIDVIPNYKDTTIRSNTLLEHMNTTKDKSDYLWYTFSFEPNSSCTQPVLHVESLAHVVDAFVNNNFSGSGHGSKNGKGPFIMEVPVVLNDEGIINNISLLSVMVGLPDSGAFLEKRYAGLTRVEIQCTEEKEVYNFTSTYNWGYQVGLLGEELEIYDEEYMDSVNWTKTDISLPQPLTWYKTNFESPKGNDPVVINLASMGKGEAWVNGQSIGRFWISFLTSKSRPSQTLYHIPREFLNSSRNVLVIMEELGGNPLKITLNTLSTIDSPKFATSTSSTL